MEVLNVDPGCRYDARNLLVQIMSGQGASKSTLRAPRICTLRTKRLQSNPEPSRPILRTLSGGAREDAPCKGRRAVQKAATARGMQNRVSKSGRPAFHKKQLDSCWRSTQTHKRGGQSRCSSLIACESGAHDNTVNTAGPKCLAKSTRAD